jgi:hypothetical protein
MSDETNPTTGRHSGHETRLTLIERDMAKLNHSLFGNGQPGVFDKIDKRLAHIEHQVNNIRMAVLLAFSVGGAGGAAVTMVIKTLLGAPPV